MRTKPYCERKPDAFWFGFSSLKKTLAKKFRSKKVKPLLPFGARSTIETEEFGCKHCVTSSMDGELCDNSSEDRRQRTNFEKVIDKLTESSQIHLSLDLNFLFIGCW